MADLDFVVSGPGAVAETVSEDFLVSHYHLPQPGVPKFMLQLVDPVTALRIDVFPDLVGSLKRARWFTLMGQPVRVLTLESILEHKLLTLSKARRPHRWIQSMLTMLEFLARSSVEKSNVFRRTRSSKTSIEARRTGRVIGAS